VDGFTVGFPTDTALDGRQSMVVFGMNGEPLPAEHGFPRG
jgi:DMSO/TMAO reductase YedYZ molybdopterin-dependent catalytic subunit